MNRQELLSRCLPILAALKSGGPTEDSLVELKARLPEDRKAARILAGMANSVHGEPVIWLVGADEKSRTIVGAKNSELANWHPQLARFFDGEPPRLLLVENIQAETGTVVALAFDTSDAPYVVRTEGDCRDVPWREGNRTRSARRVELVQMLASAELVDPPQVKIINAAFRVERDIQDRLSRIILMADLYVTPTSDKMVVLPRHDCSTSLAWTDPEKPAVRSNAVWLLESKTKGGEVPADVAFPRPGACLLMAFFGLELQLDGKEAMLRLEMLPAGGRRPVSIQQPIRLAAVNDVRRRPHRARRAISL